ncbi:MAG TPA: DUF4416 family protein [Spirochaetales bacterium]|nr:DUF4416 family protein [Spirochaetales bacterium]HRY53616.1 DUF4416 family protein [Spirochaetia bacterium]HRZ64620.1 DUF4416 family protein [Spirochaetia bacterium]
MGRPSDFEPERLVLALLYPAGTELGPLRAALEGRLGPADYVGPELPFPWTSYYEAEMGGELRRGFLSFARSVDPSGLADLKLWTNGLEEALAVGGRRRVNLDPGLLSLGRFCLATTKDRSHRIPLGRGIYAELTLVYEGGEFRPLPWTYADWRSPEYRVLLGELRERHRLARREALKRPDPARA